ncbi:MAG: arsenic transporter, partial [Synergistales bacterium]|nr:arsenic transporter [Synergistales bacterium]
MGIQGVIAVLVFVVATYCMAKGYLTRATATLMAASTLMFFRIIPSDVAFDFIDFNTIGLLIGMMIIVGVLSRSGLFQYVAVKAIKL